jgi:murein DD-endopeptidase MepM/ murein hydrolase activator NlpD
VPQHHRAPGRHRRAEPRHRAPSPLASLPLPTDERGRKVLISATLTTALAVGVAGGTAVASSSGGSGPAPLTTTGAAATVTTGATDDFADLAPGRTDYLAAAAPQPTARAAAPARRKQRPVVKTAAVAAWVNPNPAAVVTSCFGERWGRLHAGVDLAAPDGSPILAAGAGVVVRAGEAQGYGNAVLIDHGNGYLTHYGHLSSIAVVVGQHVGAGEQIGTEGSTGHSTGPHLHFEVHEGFYKNPIEPTAWLHDHGVDIPGCLDRPETDQGR